MQAIRLFDLQSHEFMIGGTSKSGRSGELLAQKSFLITETCVQRVDIMIDLSRDDRSEFNCMCLQRGLTLDDRCVLIISHYILLYDDFPLGTQGRD
jgi:hypothetical protein